MLLLPRSTTMHFIWWNNFFDNLLMTQKSFLVIKICTQLPS